MASFTLLDAEYLFTFKSQFCPDLTDATVLEWLIKMHRAVGGSEKKKKNCMMPRLFCCGLPSHGLVVGRGEMSVAEEREKFHL